MAYSKRSEYLRVLNNMRNNYQNGGNALINTLDDSTSVGEELSSFAYMNTPLPKNESGSFVEDVNSTSTRNGLQRVLDTGEELFSNVSKGALNFLDGIGDFLIGVAGAIGSVFGADSQWAEDAIDADWISPLSEVTMMFNPFDILSGDVFGRKYYNDIGSIGSASGAQRIGEERHQGSFVSNAGEGFQNAYNSVTEGVGYVLPSIVAGIATGGASNAVRAATGYGMMAATGISATGSGTEEALQDGATLPQALGSGAISGLIEVGTEVASAGLGKLAGKILGKSVSYGTKIGGTQFANAIGKASVKELGQTAIEEGLEELVSELLSPFTKTTYKGVGAFEDYKDPQLYKDSLISFLGGSVGGLVAGGVQMSNRKARYTSKGIACMNDLNSIIEMREQAQNEAKKGVSANQDIISKLENRIGEKVKSYVSNMESLKTSNPEAFKNVIKVLENPGLELSSLEKELNKSTYDSLAQEISRDMTNMKKGKATQIIFGKEEDFDLLNKNSSLENGTEVKNRAIFKKLDNGTNTIVIDPRYKSQFYELVGHEAISHGLLDNTQRMESLETYIEKDSKLSELYHSSDTVLETLYGTNETTIRSERMAKFLENFISNHKSLMKVVGSNPSSIFKARLKLVFGSIKKYLDPKRDSKMLNKIESAINSISNTSNSDLGVDSKKKNAYDTNIKEGYSYDFRRIQAESRRLHSSISQQEKSDLFDVSLRERVTRVLSKEIRSFTSGNSYNDGLLNNTSNFKIYNGIDGNLFHDVFEIAKTYLLNGELVDLHDNYNDATCYLSDDGLSGFAVTNDGDLVSVYNLSEKRGFLKAIAPFVKENVKTLDCYASPHQNLKVMYETILGFKTTSIMEYNMEYDHDDIAKNHQMPKVAFMVNTTEEINTQKYDKNQYDEAKKYQMSFVHKTGEVKYSRFLVSGVSASKDYAQHMQEKVLDLKSAKDVYELLIDSIANRFGADIKIQRLQDLVDLTTIAFNKYLNNPKKLSAILSKTVDYLLQSKIEYQLEGNTNEVSCFVNNTFGEHLQNLGVDIAGFKSECVQAFKDILQSKSKDTKIKRISVFYKTRIASLATKIQYHKTNSYYTIKSFQEIKRIKSKLEKHTLPGVANKIGDIHFPELNYYKGLVKGIKLSKSKQGISPKSIDHIINNFSTYTPENINKFQWISFNEDIRSNVDFLIAQQENGVFPNRALTFEENKAVLDILSFISKDMSDLIKEETIKRHHQVEKADGEVKVLHEIYYNKGKENFIQKELDLASSVDTVIGRYFGTNSDTYKIMYKDVMDSYNTQLIKQWEFLGSFDKIKDEFKIKDRDLSKLYQFKGESISADILLDMYCQTQTAVGLETLQNGGYNFVSKNGKTKHLKLSPNDISTLSSLIPDNLLKFGNRVLKDLYNGELKAYKSSVDIRIKGFEDVIKDDVYYPTNKAETTNFTTNSEAADYQSLDASKTSLNQERKNVTHKPLKGMAFVNRYKAYTNALTKYGEMYETLKIFDTLMNQYTVMDNGRKAPRSSIIFEISENFGKYLNYLKDQIAGNKIDKSRLSNSKMMSNIVSATLYGNVSVVLKQTASIPTIMMEVKFSSWLKGLAGSFGKLAKYKNTKANLKMQSGLLASRWGSFDAIKAQTLSNNVTKVAKFFGAPMEKMDEAVIVMFGYSTAQYEAEALGYGKVGTETNTKEAIKILNRIVANTQSNAIPIKMSMNRAGASGTIRKALSYFSSDLQNKINYLNLFANEKRQAKKRLKAITAKIEKVDIAIANTAVEEDSYASLLKQKEIYKKIQSDAQFIVTGSDKRAWKLLLQTVLSALMIASIEQLVERLYGRKDWNENSLDDFAKALLLNSVTNSIPYINNFVNSIEYNQNIGTFEFGVLQSFIDVATSIKEGKPWQRVLFNSVVALGTATGIPLKNLYNLVMGVYKNVSGEGYKVDSIVKGYNPTYIMSQYKKSLENGRNNQAQGLLQLLYSNKTGFASTDVLEEVNTLNKKGYNALPKDRPISYNNENGETVDFTAVQSTTFANIYSESNNLVSELSSITDYQRLDDENKAKAIKKAYDTYYDYAKMKALKTASTNKLANLLYASNGRLDISKFIIGLTALANVEKTENKTRKELVLEKINKMTNLSRAEKLLLVYLNGFKLTDTNKVVLQNYLSQKSITNKDLAEILGLKGKM